MRGRQLVGKNVRRIRVDQGISQERLAYDAGVDRSYLGGIERGEENPTVDVLERLANRLDVAISDLFLHLAEDSRIEGLPRGRKPKHS